MTESRPYIQRLPLYFYMVLANTYGFVTSLVIVIWLLTGQYFWFVRVFFNLMPPLLFPALIALLIGVVLRKWRPVLLVIPATILFFGIYGTAFLPKNPPAAMPNLTVLTYNLHAHNIDFDGIAAIVQDSEADIITMQELRPDMVDFLQATFDETYPYWIVHPEKGGTIMLSRYPIRDVNLEDVTSAIVDVDGLDVLVFAIHLPVPNYGIDELRTGGFLRSESRQTKLATLHARIRAVDMPHIMLGDFNMADSSGDYRQLARQYTDVFRATSMGLGLTFPNWRGINPDIVGWPPLIRIDYVFVSDDIIPIEAQVLRTGFSDHYALMASLRLVER